MLRRILTTVLLTALTSTLALTAGAPAAEAAPGRRSLGVLTFNIHHGAGTDDVLSLERIASVIKNSDADLVGLQEVDRHYSARSNWADQAAGVREIARVLAPTGLLAFADALPPAATRLARWARRRQTPPPAMLNVFVHAGLHLRAVEWLSGFGRLGEAVIVLATPED